MKLPLFFITQLLSSDLIASTGTVEQSTKDSTGTRVDATPADVANVASQEAFGKFDDDGYQWSNIFEEANDMLDASLLMYPIAELRRVAREFPENFSDPDDILKEPITASEVEQLLVDNAKTLMGFFGNETMGVLNTVMDTIVARQQTDVGKHRKPTATLIDFADDNSNSELVYAIGKDDARKRVTVSFRGSVTMTDWRQDAQIWMEKIANPLAHIKGQPKNIRIHHGFYEYLFYTTTHGETRKDGTLMSKYELIIAQAASLLKKNPGYKLFVTGHSLGAALSSVFAFMAATEESIPSPVTCVSIASPYVGGINFRKSFQHLEETNRLRYLRVANQGDMVTIVPFASLNLGFYKHVGFELKLHPGKFTLTYPKGKRVRRVWRNSIFRNFNPGKATRNHAPAEYDQRLELTKSMLKQVFLNDLYGELHNKTSVK
mmetsp:Transcript_1722/g.2662  ORF Transcript_1722/g.2662 Transcript_1722/m.2662 type:complete len:433 (+) Transcript_1722:160-1458(+)